MNRPHMLLHSVFSVVLHNGRVSIYWSSWVLRTGNGSLTLQAHGLAQWSHMQKHVMCTCKQTDSRIDWLPAA